MQAFRRYTLTAIVGFFILAAASMLAAWFKQRPQLLGMGALLGGIGLTLMIDFWGSLQSVPSLSNRALFFYWVKVNRTVRFGYILWFAIVIGMGVTQWLLQKDETFENMVLRFGLVYDSALSDEWWRFLTGPYFHSGLSHYLNNAISLLFVGPILWALIGYRCLLVFTFGNVIAAFCEFLVGGYEYDSYLGVSGGLFAMYGTLVAGAWLTKGLLPEGMTVLCTAVVLMSAAGSSLLATNVANVAHVIGLAFGFAASLVLRTRIQSMGFKARMV